MNREDNNLHQIQFIRSYVTYSQKISLITKEFQVLFQLNQNQNPKLSFFIFLLKITC